MNLRLFELDSAIRGNPWPVLVVLVAVFASFVAAGFRANDWYLAEARRAVAAVRGQGLEGEARLRELARRGGVNTWAVFGLFAAMWVANFAVAVVLNVVLGPAFRFR